MQLLHTRPFGLVALVAVGATCVGSINTVLPEEAFAEKGANLGYFAFGGSTILVLFQPGTVTFDYDLVRNSGTPLETLVRVGERIGVAAAPHALHSHAIADDDDDYIRYEANVAARRIVEAEEKAAAAGAGAGAASRPAAEPAAEPAAAATAELAEPAAVSK